jgi:hypothetical protein
MYMYIILHAYRLYTRMLCKYYVVLKLWQFTHACQAVEKKGQNVT